MRYDLWINEREKAVIDKETGLKILTQETPGKWHLKIWMPKAKNPHVNYYYKDAESRQAKIDSSKRNLLAHKASMAEYKAKNGGLSTHARVAQIIRRILKSEFPETVFSVRSSSFAGGDDVNVSWENGPQESRVDAIISAYESGSFDGMTDCYNYDRFAPKFSIKYAFANRHISDDLQKSMFEVLRSRFDIWKDAKDMQAHVVVNGAWRDISQEIWRYCKNYDLTGVKGFIANTFEGAECQYNAVDELLYGCNGSRDTEILPVY